MHDGFMVKGTQLRSNVPKNNRAMLRPQMMLKAKDSLCYLIVTRSSVLNNVDL